MDQLSKENLFNRHQFDIRITPLSILTRRAQLIINRKMNLSSRYWTNITETERKQSSYIHTISQLCPVKLSRHSHLYDPGRLIQVFAARHGWIVLHSSISIEQSTPVHPESKDEDRVVHTFSSNTSLLTTDTGISIR